MSPTATGPLSTYAPDLFAGKTVLVTGGGRGIGRLTALAFGRLGANVSIGGRNADNLAKTRAEIEALCRVCVANTTDIRDVESVESMVAACPIGARCHHRDQDQIGGADRKHGCLRRRACRVDDHHVMGVMQAAD